MAQAHRRQGPGAQWMPPALAKRMLRGAKPDAAAPNGAERPRRRLERWQPIMPAPRDAPQAGFRHAKLGRPSATWEYRSAMGRTLFHVAGSIWRTAAKRSCRAASATWTAPAAGIGRPRRERPPRPLYGLPGTSPKRPQTRPCSWSKSRPKCAVAARRIGPFAGARRGHVARVAPRRTGKADWSTA